MHKKPAVVLGVFLDPVIQGLDLFLIEKPAYEIAYEAAYRPTWIGVPLGGLARLTTRITGKETRGQDD